MPITQTEKGTATASTFEGDGPGHLPAVRAADPFAAHRMDRSQRLPGWQVDVSPAVRTVIIEVRDRPPGGLQPPLDQHKNTDADEQNKNPTDRIKHSSLLIQAENCRTFPQSEARLGTSSFDSIDLKCSLPSACFPSGISLSRNHTIS